MSIYWCYVLFILLNTGVMCTHFIRDGFHGVGKYPVIESVFVIFVNAHCLADFEGENCKKSTQIQTYCQNPNFRTLRLRNANFEPIANITKKKHLPFRRRLESRLSSHGSITSLPAIPKFFPGHITSTIFPPSRPRLLSPANTWT